MKATATNEWPRDGLEAVAACPVCGGERRVRMADGLRDRLFSAPGEWALWRCGGCRSAYLDPRPTAETLGLAYADYMHHQPPPDAAPSGPLGALRERLLNGYLAARYGYRREPSLRIGAPLLSLLPPDPSHRDKCLRPLHWPGGEP